MLRKDREREEETKKERLFFFFLTIIENSAQVNTQTTAGVTSQEAIFYHFPLIPHLTFVFHHKVCLF